jgi:hypothetical protein
MAQGTVQAVDNVIFSSNSVEDPTRQLTYGFGSDYSDTVDFNKGEQILPPFFPPEGFFAFFGIKDKTGSEDFGTKDVRGVPDSVRNGTADNFSLQWTIRLKRGTGQDISISLQFPLLHGVDSVNFQSTQAGANFNYTFTDRGQVLIPNSLITALKMTAYYNYPRVLSVPNTPREQGPAALRFYPNPARSGRDVMLAGTTPAGSRVEVIDVYGSVVERQGLGEARSNAAITLPRLPAGAYMLRVVGASNDVISQGRMVVSE